MKVAYFGYLWDNKAENPAVSAISNNMQIGLLRELSEKLCGNLEIYSFQPRRRYPHDKTLFVNAVKRNATNEVFWMDMPFVNLFLVKYICVFLYTLFLILNFCFKNRNDKRVIITYHVSTVFSLPLWIVSLFFRIEKVCLVSDALIDCHPRATLKQELARKLDNFFRKKLIRSYDKYLAINPDALRRWGVDKPCLQIYVGADSTESSKSTRDIPVGNKRCTITYTGALETYYHLEDVVDAVEELGDQYVFQVYGRGGLVDKMLELNKTKTNLEFKGLLDNDLIRTIQSEADILVCLLEPTSYIGMNAFPGKIFEYLLSGTPIISLKTPSIPENIFQYVNLIDSADIETLKDAILRLTAPKMYQEALDKAEQGKQFVLENCSYRDQVQKIYAFLYRNPSIH